MELWWWGWIHWSWLGGETSNICDAGRISYGAVPFDGLSRTRAMIAPPPPLSTLASAHICLGRPTLRAPSPEPVHIILCHMHSHLLTQISIMEHCSCQTGLVLDVVGHTQWIYTQVKILRQGFCDPWHFLTSAQYGNRRKILDYTVWCPM